MIKETSSISNIKYIVIDSRLGKNPYDKKVLLRILDSSIAESCLKVFLNYINEPELADDLLDNLLDAPISYTNVNIENKKNGIDFEKVLKLVSEFEKHPISSVSDKIFLGKKILYLTHRSSKWIRWFKESKECPGFWLLTTGNFCPHNCKYCFLNLTLRTRSIPTININLSSFRTEMKKFASLHPESILLNCGESNDPLAFEPITKTFSFIARTVTSYPKKSLLVVTKSCNVYEIPDDLGSVIFSWSINPEVIQRKFELDSATTEQRLEAAKYVSEVLEYKIRFRIDPIICPDLFSYLSNGSEVNYESFSYELEPYYKLIDKIRKLENLNGITLGTFRAYSSLFNFIPDFKELKSSMEQDVGHLKLPKSFRNWVFSNIEDYINETTLECPIGYCKDTIWKNENYCNCLGEKK